MRNDLSSWTGTELESSIAEDGEPAVRSVEPGFTGHTFTSEASSVAVQLHRHTLDELRHPPPGKGRRSHMWLKQRY